MTGRPDLDRGMSLRVRNRRDLLAGLLFAAIGCAVAFGSLSYELGSLRAMGPGFVPLAVAVMLGLLGAAIMIGALDFGGDADEDGLPAITIAWRPLLTVCVAIVAAGATLEPLGLLVALAALLGILSLLRGSQTMRSALALYVVLALIGALVFVAGLGLRLPLLPGG